MNNQTIQVEKIDGGLSLGMLDLHWKLEELIDEEIQHYTVTNPLMPVEHGAVMDNIHMDFVNHLLGFIMPFTGSEQVCWECGGQRVLELKYDIRCGCMTWKDWCYCPTHHRKGD